jgi:hypothetical protein
MLVHISRPDSPGGRRSRRSLPGLLLLAQSSTLALWKNGVMSAYRAQTHIDAPLEDVWALVGNPSTYPEWWPAAVEIRGQTFEVGDAIPRCWRSPAGGSSTAGSSTSRRAQRAEMELPDHRRLPALAADRGPGRNVRGHGNGNRPAGAPIRAIRQNGRAPVHQALGRTGHEGLRRTLT